MFEENSDGECTNRIMWHQIFSIVNQKHGQEKKCELSIKAEAPTLFAQKSPQALHRDLGPEGPRRIIGVDFELMPQCVHLKKGENDII